MRQLLLQQVAAINHRPGFADNPVHDLTHKAGTRPVIEACRRLAKNGAITASVLIGAVQHANGIGNGGFDLGRDLAQDQGLTLQPEEAIIEIGADVGRKLLPIGDENIHRTA